MVVVIDASVYVSRVHRQEAHHHDSVRLLDAVAARGMDVLCPEILVAEVAAAIGRGTDDAESAYLTAAHLRKLPGHRLVSVDRPLGDLAARLAAERGLRGCDAVYVALARREGARLITWDAQQRERAEAVVEALTPVEALAALG